MFCYTPIRLYRTNNAIIPDWRRCKGDAFGGRVKGEGEGTKTLSGNMPPLVSNGLI